MSFVKNDKYELWTPDGFVDFDGIQLKGEDDLYKISTNDNFVTSTKDHNFFVNNEKISTNQLNIGDIIDGSDKIINISFDRKDKVFDIINVKNDNHSFIVNNSFHSKNCLDEYAFLPKHVASAFWAANYPTISASTDAKIVIISTPNGLHGQYYTIYTEAERHENSFKSYMSTWRDIPGRDDEWAKIQIKNLGKQRFNQEYACLFLGSTNTVIDPITLEFLYTQHIEPIHIDMNGKFKIYEKPIKNCQYVLGIDVSKGTGGDYSVIQVLKLVSIKPIQYEQVAVFSDNFTDVYSFADIINRVCIYYNYAYIMVENNGEGSAIVNKLWWDIENEKLVNTGNKEVDLGIRATKNTKPKAVLLMKKIIEDNCIKIRDKETVDQLSSFIESKGKFYGKDLHDDLVSALYWAMYITEMDLFDETPELKTKQNDDEDDVWGILSDITDDPQQNSFEWLNNVFN